MTCEFERTDGAYVLGALSANERLEYERHLSRCDACSQSVRDLAGLPGLLAQVDLDVLDDDSRPPVPRTVLPAVLADVRHTQRRRTLVAGGLAACVAAVAAAAAWGVATSGDTGSSVAGPTSATTTSTSTAPVLPMQALGDVHVSADARLAAVAWGTRIDITCSYDDDEGSTYWPERDPEYTLVVQTRSGRTERVGSWRGLPGRTMQLTAATATTQSEIETVELLRADGTPVLRLTV